MRYSTPVKASAMAPVPAIASRVPFADHHVLVAFAEAQPVIGGGSQRQDEHDRRAQERAVVDVALDRVQFLELAGKRMASRKPNRTSAPGDEGAQLLKQLAVLALEPFFAASSSRPSPSPCSITSSEATPPTPGSSSTLREPGSALCPWVAWSVALAPDGTSRIGRMINGMLHSARPQHSSRDGISRMGFR